MIMRQKRNTPRKELLCRLTVENYRFVVTVSELEDVSIADVLNFLIDKKRESDTTICNSMKSRSNIAEVCQMKTRLSLTP